jgi:hypothetical protein
MGFVHNLGRFRLSVTAAREETLWREHWRTSVLRRARLDGWTRLSAALYLGREWQAALNVLLKATAAPSGGNGWDRLLLAQIYTELGHHDQARRWRDNLFAWMAENAADEDLWQFAAESLSAGRAGELGDFLASGVDPTRSDSWEVLEPVGMATAGGTSLMVQPDRSIMASGKNALPETYTITARTRLDGITAVRLEVLPHPTLPGDGPGRAPNGNFVLNEFRITAALEGNPLKARPVVLQKAWADFSQQLFPVADAIDGIPHSGWAVAPDTGRSHVAIFEVKEPVPTANGTILLITVRK